MANEDKTLGTKDNPIGENNQYDPEEEKRAIEAEENYKRIHGHYREGSVYKKALEEKEKMKNLGTKDNPIGEKNMYDPEEEKRAIEAEKSWARNHGGKYRQSSAWVGVRRNLSGESIGEYDMRNSKR